jgi:hypothetical protein
MKTFLKWVEETDRGLIGWASDNKLNVENILRTGVRFGYPDAYVRAQYPGGYFPPATATAALDLDNAKKFKSVAAPEGTPG